YLFSPALLSFPTRRSSDLRFYRLGPQPDYDKDIRIFFCRFAYFFVRSLGMLAELEHVAQDRDFFSFYFCLSESRKSRKSSDWGRSEEHTSELQSRFDLVCR